MPNPKLENRNLKPIRSPKSDRARGWPAIGNLQFSILNLKLPLLVAALCAFTVGAADYVIDWSTLDGGGGTSTSGVFTVTGTIGQPDASQQAMTGGNYSLVGGFWSLLAAVQTPGAPLLSIARTTTNTVAVSWPSPSTGWTLQQNTNSVRSLNWSNVTSGIQDDGTNKTYLVNPPTGNRYFRLFIP